MLEYSHDHGLESPLDLQGDYPLQTKTTTELLLHCEALQMLFVGEDPLLVPLWPTDKGKLRFYVGDASREGFGIPNTLMVLSYLGRDFGKPGLLKGILICEKHKTRSITFYGKSELVSTTGANSGQPLTMRCGLPCGRKGCRMRGIYLAWSLL